MNGPASSRPRVDGTSPLERLAGEIERRTEVVEIFHNEGAIARSVGPILLELNDEWPFDAPTT